MVRNVDMPSKFLKYPRFLQVVINNQVDDLTSHNTKYTSPALTQKVFANMRRVGKGFSGVETPLFASMLVQPQPQAEEEEEEVAELEQDKQTQALEILKLKKRVKKLEKKKDQRRIDQEDVNAASKGVNAVEPTVFDDEEYDDKEENIDWNAITKQVQERHLDNIRKGMNYEKVRPIFEKEYKKVQTLFKPDKDVEEPKKKIVVKETLLQESFKKLKAVKVSGSEEIPSNDLKEVMYPIIDWEIHSEGSRTYWKIIRVGGITEAYQSFEDMLKGFDREDLVALWNLVKEKFSLAMPREDKEKALWVKLKRLFEPNADDVFWKLQRYMHDPLTWKLYTNCGVHYVSSTKRHDIFMLTEKDYPLSNVVMILVLSAKLQVEEDCEIARDLVMKIFMEANKPKSRRKVDTAAEAIEEFTLSG
nr:hypothetical protein [Tanacetum cinerariifolium]